MNSSLQSIIGDYMIKYQMFIGENNPENIIERSGPSFLSLPSATLEKLLNLNPNATLSL
jgi:hypothetical protein